MRTTIIDVKFDEKSKYELRIGLPCKGKPENAENFRKIIFISFSIFRFFEFPAFSCTIRAN